MKDEESIGVDSPDGGVGISCRVGASGSGKTIQRTTCVSSSPGSAIRVSILFPNAGRNKSSARILAFIDPISGRGVVRIGMFDISKSRSGHEVGPQVVWETDTPVWNGNK